MKQTQLFYRLHSRPHTTRRAPIMILFACNLFFSPSISLCPTKSLRHKTNPLLGVPLYDNKLSSSNYHHISNHPSRSALVNLVSLSLPWPRRPNWRPKAFQIKIIAGFGRETVSIIVVTIVVVVCTFRRTIGKHLKKLRQMSINEGTFFYFFNR